MSQPTVLELLQSEMEKISSLNLQLAAKGIQTKPFHRDENENPLEKLHAARDQSKFLEQLLAQTPTFVSLTPPAAATPPPTPIPSPVAAPASKLTNYEISRLNWTEQCNYAQGKLSDEDARNRIANRNWKKTGPTLTEQCMAVTGGKDQINRAE